MPELPDVTVYVESIAARVVGERLEGVRLANPFVLRTFDPPPSAVAGRTVRGVRRVGKRVALGLDDDLFVVVHLMIAGRFRWLAPKAKLPGKIGVAAFDFERGALILTEASTKKRAAIHIVRGEGGVAALDAGGVDPIESDAATFRDAVVRESHTLKRTLTDPHLFSGIGNAYSDEILHRARLSPLRLTRQMSDDEIARLRAATIDTLTAWTKRLRAEAAGGFPERVTAFRAEMAVHGRAGEPCPVCGSPVQRVVYAENEMNYCATCQTGGKLLADRALSRLMKKDWPRTLEELEERQERLRGG